MHSRIGKHLRPGGDTQQVQGDCRRTLGGALWETVNGAYHTSVIRLIGRSKIVTLAGNLKGVVLALFSSDKYIDVQCPFPGFQGTL